MISVWAATTAALDRGTGARPWPGSCTSRRRDTDAVPLLGESLRIVVVGTLAYASLVLLLRVSGKRTLSRMNAFDLVVTVALGSVLSSTLLSRTTTLADGLTALLLLVGLQFAVAWLSARWPRFERLVKAEPTLLAFRGELQEVALRRQRVTADDVLAAVRRSGGMVLADAAAVVLETDGRMSVVPAEALPAREP